MASSSSNNHTINNISNTISANNAIGNGSSDQPPFVLFDDPLIVEEEETNETLLLWQFYEETRQFERRVGVIIPSIFAVFALFGLLGNLLVVIVALHRQMRNSTNTLIIGLTCSDLMFLTLCIPFTAIDYASPIWVLPTWMCPLINYLQHSSAYFSVWTLTLMAVDRFLAVVFPVESMTFRSPRNTFFVLIAVYSIILLSQIQVGRIHGVYSYTFITEQRSACSIVSIAQGLATVTEARLYFFSFNIFGYCLPLGITCVLYYFMLKRLWYSPRSSGSSVCAKAMPCLNCNAYASSSSSNSSLRSRPETIRAKRKVTRLVLCVVIIWAVCWFPMNLCFFASGLIYPDTLVLRGGKPVVIAQIFSQVLAYCNSTLNPILYPLVSENFRKGFLRVLCSLANWLSCGRCCKQFQLYNARMELTILNRSNSNKSKQMSRSNSKNTTGSTKTTNNVQTAQASMNEPPSLLSILHRPSIPKRCSAVSITTDRPTTNFVSSSAPRIVRVLSRRESANFLAPIECDSHTTTTIINKQQQPPQMHRPGRRLSHFSAPLQFHPHRHSDHCVKAEEKDSGGGRRENDVAERWRRRTKTLETDYRFEDGDQEI